MTGNDVIDAPLLTEDDTEDLDLKENAKKEERAFLDEFELNDDVHEYYARIYRVVDGRQVYIEQVGPEAFPILDRLRKVHKGGKFRAMIFKDKRIFKNKTYDIEPLKDEIPAPQNSQIADLAALLAKNNEQMAAIIQGQPPNTPQQSSTDQFTAIITALATAKELFTPPEPKKDNTIEMLLKGIEIAKESANPNSERNLYDVIGDVIKSPIGERIGDALQAQQKTQLQIPSVYNQAPPQNNAPQMPPQQKVNPPTNNLPPILQNLSEEQIEQLRQQILYLEGRALHNSEPELYADLLLDQFPHEYLTYLVTGDNAMQILSYFAPTAPIHWFQQLFTSVAEGLTDSPQTGDNNTMSTSTGNSAFTSENISDPAANAYGNPAGSGGNLGNAETNAGTDKTG